MSTLPTNQFWCTGSSIFMGPCNSLHLGEASQSQLEMKLHWCLQVGLIVFKHCAHRIIQSFSSEVI